jgi:hypothetical protein
MVDFDFSQYRALVGANIKVDLRGQRSKRKYSRIVGVLLSYSVTSVMMSAFLFNRSDIFTFSFLMVSVAMMMTAFSVITGYDTLVGSTAEYDILGHHPVSSRTRFFAKITNLLFYVFLVGVPLTFPSAIFMFFAPKGNLILSVSFVLVSVLSLLFTVSGVIALYSLVIDKIPQQRLKDIISYFQIAFVFLVIIGYQIIPYLSSTHTLGISLGEIKWLCALPPSWFVSLMYLLTMSIEDTNMPLSVLAIVSLCIMFFVMVRILSRGYIHISEKLMASDKDSTRIRVRSPENFFEKIKRFLLPDQEECAGYDLMSIYIRRDRSTRMRILPGVAMPIAIMLFGIFTDQLPDPFIFGIFTGVSNVHFTVLFVTLFAAVFILGALKFSPHYDAAWVYSSTPLVGQGRFARGARKAVVIIVVGPTFALMLALFWTQMIFYHALLHTLFVFCGGWLAFTFFSIFERGMPLSRKEDKLETSNRFVKMLLSLPLFFLLSVIQYFAYQSENYAIVALVSLSVLIELVETIRIRLLNRKPREET